MYTSVDISPPTDHGNTRELLKHIAWIQNIPAQQEFCYYFFLSSMLKLSVNQSQEFSMTSSYFLLLLTKIERQYRKVHSTVAPVSHVVLLDRIQN